MGEANEDFDEAFAGAVMETLGHVDPNRDFLETDPPEDLDKHELPRKGVIGFEGDHIKGHVVMGCVDEFLEATSPLESLPAGKEDQLLMDWLGEMLNLVLGNFKRKMESHKLSFKINAPDRGASGDVFKQFGEGTYGDGNIEEFWFDCDSHLMCLQLSYKMS